MPNVLADLRARSGSCDRARAAARARVRRAARRAERALARLATPAAKYWVCKRAPTVAAEAMEVLGGNGYVEESALPRLYREAPVNSIWEGSGNVMCLDVLRAVAARTGCGRGVEAPSSRSRAAPTRGSIGTLPGSPIPWPTARSTRQVRDGWRATLRWPWRHRCWCGTRLRRSPTHSVRRASASIRRRARHPARRHRLRRDHRASRRLVR